MTTVAVCICTFRNPAGLHSILQGLDKQDLDTVSDQEVTIAVVDNDAEDSAAAVLEWYSMHGRFTLRAQQQPKRGLSTARNSALQLALATGAELFAFLDDDEIPGIRWLQSLVSTFDDPSRSIVIGPVEPVFEAPPPSWIVDGHFFHKRCNDDGLHEGYTSNVMIRSAIIAASGVQFDEALNSIGGEDVVFFRALRDLGYGVHCAPAAVVSETIPRSRATLRWMMRRWLRSGATSSRLMSGSKTGLRQSMLNAARGAARIGAGSVLVVATALLRGRRDFAAVARAIAPICRGAGMLMAAFGKSYQEYGSTYRREPPGGTRIER